MKARSISIQLAIFLIALLSCNKLEFRNEISGVWKILNISGGFVLQSPEPHFTILQVKKNNSFYISRNDTLLAHGSYDLYKSDQDPVYKDEPYEIQFNSGYNHEPRLVFPFGERLIVRFFSTDTLVLDEGCCDRFTYTFTRSK